MLSWVGYFYLSFISMSLALQFLLRGREGSLCGNTPSLQNLSALACVNMCVSIENQLYRLLDNDCFMFFAFSFSFFFAFNNKTKLKRIIDESTWEKQEKSKETKNAYKQKRISQRWKNLHTIRMRVHFLQTGFFDIRVWCGVVDACMSSINWLYQRSGIW